LRVIFLLLVLFSLNACSISDFKFSGFKTNLVAKISQGMSKKEVEERIGNERFLIEIPDATLMF
jgi:outer membrane protein assembly factor BamE (lipoprotein component of BamABCDE complex)